MLKRLIPLSLLVACATAACVSTVQPPGVTPQASPSAMATTATGATPAATATPAGTATAAPAATATPSPSSSDEADDAAEIAEACEHVEDGPSKAVTANLVTMSRERAVLTADHTRFDVGLIKNGGQSEGYVLFNSADASSLHVYLNKDVALKVIQDGKTLAIEEQSKSPASCAAIKAMYEVEVGVGQVELHFGPTEETSVGVVLEAHAEDDHDHDHED